MFPLCKAPSRVSPMGVSISFSPFTVSFTLPEGISLAFATSSSATSSSTMMRNTATLAPIVSPDISNKTILYSCLYVYIPTQILNPEKHMKAMPMRPVRMKAIPSPRSGLGTSE